MKTLGSINTIKREFEIRLFQYGLIVSILFRAFQTIHEYLVGAPLTVSIIGLCNLSLVLLLLKIYRKHFTLAVIVFYYTVLVTSVIVWNHSGGWEGPRPYVLLVLVVFIVITSHGFLQLITLLSYGLVLIYLSQATLPESWGKVNENYSLLSLEVDFFVNILILVLITLYLKVKFFEYKWVAEETNERLQKTSETLEAQTLQLHEQQTELNAIRSNLKSMTTLKVKEVNEKATVLKDYAFVNAHNVRGPLARILGLLNLIELEGKGHPQFDTLDKIKCEARKMDTIVHRINEVTS
jgi:signal transduction histidine kinase